MLTEELMREVRRLQARTKRRVQGLFSGEYHSAFRGQGIEFAEVREYEPGDDVRSIDWNVTARTGRTFVKRFVEERELSVLLAVDLSRSGEFGTAEKPKSRVAIECAAVLAFAAASNHDRVGLLLFTDRVELFLAPRRGRAHLQRLLRELLGFEASGRGTAIAPAIEHIGRLLRRHSLVFLVSDFESPPFERSLRAASRRHEVIALKIEDPRERELPRSGLVDLEDAETGARAIVDASSRRVRDAWRQQAMRRHAELARALARCKVDLVELSTDRPFTRDLARYFQARERRRGA